MPKAAGYMFPWIPRVGIDPPYLVSNLDCTGKPARDGVRHLRCIGVRLYNTDLTDEPPKNMPPRYRYCSQNLLERIGRVGEHMPKS
jgi:hypothetical protein